MVDNAAAPRGNKGYLLMTNELEEAVRASSMYQRSTVLEMYGAQAALLVLLYKLDVVGVRKVSQSYVLTLISGSPPPPTCSIPCAVVSLSRDYLQFCPKRMADKDLAL